MTFLSEPAADFPRSFPCRLLLSPPPAHTPAAGRLHSPDPSSSSSSTLLSPSASSPLSPPPLPSSLVPQVDSLERILEDLQSYQIPQLGDCRGPKSLFDQLTTQVRGELNRVKKDLDELKADVEDLARAREREAGFWHVGQLQDFLDQCTKSYRSAVVQAKRVIDSSQHYSMRDELLASNGRDSPALTAAGNNGAPQSGDDALMSATSDVTEGLRRTLQLLQSEVDRSQVSNELLEQQTQTMASTSHQYSTLSTLLTSSRTLITSLERADILDRLILFGAFSFFVGVCSYIFKKRVVDRGLKVASAVSGVLGRGGKGKEVGELVKEEFKGEIEKVAVATAAVVGAVKKARDVVGDKLRERGLVKEEEEKEEEKGVFEQVVEKVQRATAVPVVSSIPATTSTPSIQSVVPTSTIESSFVPPTPTAFVDQDPVSEEEELEWLNDETPEEESLEEEDEQEEEEGEAEEEEDRLFENEEIAPSPLPIPSASTAATVPPEPTPIPTSTSIPAEIEEIYTPTPTPEPSIVEETPLPASPLPVDKASEVEAPAPEATAEPEVEIIPSPLPTETAPSTPTEPHHAAEEPITPAPLAEGDETELSANEKEEEEEIEIVAPRQSHPPVPSRSQEELDEIFSTTEPSTPTPTRSSVSSEPQSEEEEVQEFATASPTTIDPSPLPSATAPILPDSEIIDGTPQELEHTTTPLERDVEPESIPRLDVEETGEEPLEEREVQGTVELPIDLEKEQSVWEEATPVVEREVEPEKEEMGEGREEELLEEMMERQMGGQGGIGIGGYYGGANDTVETLEKDQWSVEGVAEPDLELPEKEEDESPTSTISDEVEEEEVAETQAEAAPEMSNIPTDSTTDQAVPPTPTPVETPEPISSSQIRSAEPANPTHETTVAPSPSSIVYEDLPPSSSSVEPIEDVVLDQPDLSTSSEDLVFDFAHEGSLTEPLEAPRAEAEEEPSEIVLEDPIQVDLPISIPTPSPSTTTVEETPDADLPITTPVPSQRVLEAMKDFERQMQEAFEEEPNSIVDAPVPTRPSPPEPAKVDYEEPRASTIAEPSVEEEEEVPQPVEEPIATLSSVIASSTVPPKPIATPIPTPEAVPTPSSPLADEDQPEVLEDLTNSDVVFPPSDIDELPPPSATRLDDEYDSVFDDLPLYEEGSKEAVDELVHERGDDGEPTEPGIAEVSDTPLGATHVEL
ncbi:hypothetical protein JCM16303_005904 [Sporobolomyces ruberrimus]